MANGHASNRVGSGFHHDLPHISHSCVMAAPDEAPSIGCYQQHKEEGMSDELQMRKPDENSFGHQGLEAVLVGRLRLQVHGRRRYFRQRTWRNRDSEESGITDCSSPSSKVPKPNHYDYLPSIPRRLVIA